MGFWEIVVLGIALSMDACAISLCRGMVYADMPFPHQMPAPVLFCVFQGVMPMLGYFAGSIFQAFFTTYSGYVVCLILALIGGKMLLDAFRDKGGHDREEGAKDGWLLVLQAFATSVDAFGVGIGFAAIRINVFAASSIIAILTLICCTLALLLGRLFGARFKRFALFGGGIMLIALGVKAVL